MKIALFFTRGVSLKVWYASGLLSREQNIYRRLLDGRHVEQVLWLTYGAEDAALADDLRRQNLLHPGIQVCAMPAAFKSRWGIWLYSLAMGWVWRGALSGCALFKSNQLDGAWAAVLAGRWMRKPVLARSGYIASTFIKGHGLAARFRRWLLQGLESLVCQRAQVVAVTSWHDRAHVTQTSGIPAAKVRIIRNYVDTERFVPGVHQPAMPERLVFVGRLVAQKNLAALIEAVSMTNMGLDVYGEGELRPELERLARSLGADVRFMGTVSNADLPQVLQQYRVAVLPSLYEGMPKTLLEYMACGLVCVGTDVAGINEVLMHGQNGVISPAVDAASLAKALKCAVLQDQLALGSAARQHVLSEYSLEAVLDAERQLYAELIKHHVH